MVREREREREQRERMFRAVVGRIRELSSAEVSKFQLHLRGATRLNSNVVKASSAGAQATQANPTIVYTLTDEAPLLATYSFLPILQTFASRAGGKSNTNNKQQS